MAVRISQLDEGERRCDRDDASRQDAISPLHTTQTHCDDATVVTQSELDDARNTVMAGQAMIFAIQVCCVEMEFSMAYHRRVSPGDDLRDPGARVSRDGILDGVSLDPGVW